MRFSNGIRHLSQQSRIRQWQNLVFKPKIVWEVTFAFCKVQGVLLTWFIMEWSPRIPARSTISAVVAPLRAVSALTSASSPRSMSNSIPSSSRSLEAAVSLGYVKKCVQRLNYTTLNFKVQTRNTKT